MAQGDIKVLQEDNGVYKEIVLTVSDVEIGGGGIPATPTTGLEKWGLAAYWSGVGVDPLTNIDSDNDWDHISLGDIHGLAIKAGKLYAWGPNSSGRTGLNTSSNYALSPTQIGSYEDWWMVSAGYNHSLGIRKTWNEGTESYDYTLWVWGEGSNYALGNGSTTDLLVPTQIGTDTDWQWISAGFQWSCAIKGGKLYTCGNNASYRTGQNTNSGNTTTWTNYDSESTGWVMCSAGYAQGMGIKSGELFSWGTNSFGVIGHGGTSSISIPTKVQSDSDWASCKTGYLHSGAIKTDGTLWTFGLGNDGRLGHNNDTTYNVPTKVGLDTDWQKIECNANSTASGSTNFTFAIKGGKIFATGINLYGQCGQLDLTTNLLVFTQIGTGSNYIDITAGNSIGMAIRKTV